MAASSSSSGGFCKYDVFLSFRGEDTRKIFVGHLYRALKQKVIFTFMDSKDLDKGSRILELLNAIENSRLSIVVLSENYASSTWCLKELVKIMKCRDTKNQIVVPIFYQVGPSDVRNLNGKFGEAFGKHKHGADKQELESWRSALARLADLSGWDSTKYEDDSKLIEEIVEDTIEKWIHIARLTSPANDDLVGMDSHIKEMSMRLCRGVNDVGVVGIWGMGGIGKTTIAKAVYDNLFWQFRHCCFLDNVKEAFINKREVQMQEELLSELLNKKVKSVGLNRGRKMIMERLGKKKVLVVLDDVETVAHIQDLLGNPHSFGSGSRIIITTRFKQSLSGVNELYEPKELSGDAADELFMKHALNKNQLIGDYNHLSRSAIKYAQGLPLALKVLGALLRNKSVCEWEDVLEKVKTIPHWDILNVLETSFDKLDISEKNIFLDIACFFRKMKKDCVIELLHSFHFFPYSGLRTLLDRALITTFSRYYGDDRIDMHDLLQDMGKAIVCRDSLYEPGRRSRLWKYEDVVHVLTQNTATEAIEGIVLDLSNSKCDLCIDTGAFVRMTKLRLIMIYYSFYTICQDYYDVLGCEDTYPSDGCKQHATGDFQFLSHELRFLCWHGCPLKFLPSNFSPENLVELDMRGSHIQQLWEGIKPLKQLKVILLSNCRYLVKTPDLTEATNLKRLVLDGCSSLIDVHPSISALQNLLILSLKGCKELKIFPSSIYMKSLQTLDLSGCSNLDKFPEISEKMEELTKLYLDETAIKELPSTVNNLTRLVICDLSGCRELKILPSSIRMKCLRTLDLSGCSNLEEFLEISEVMEDLTELYLGGTAIKELPSSIEHLQGLKSVSMRNCRSLISLPDSICNLAHLRFLDLSGCSKLSSLPENVGSLKSLAWLEVQDSGIKQLPLSISRLRELKISFSYKEYNAMKTPFRAWSSFIASPHFQHTDQEEGELSELGSHSGFPVPETQLRGKKRKSTSMGVSVMDWEHYGVDREKQKQQRALTCMKGIKIGSERWQ